MKRPGRLGLEAYWLLPFAFLALCTMALTRPQHVIPVTFEGDAVTITDERGNPYRDRQGNTIQVPTPPQRVAQAFLRNYLPKTHAPELLSNLGDPKDQKGFAGLIVASIYPELLEDRHWRGNPGNLEVVLADNAPGDLYFGGGVYYSSIDLRNFGLIIINPEIPSVSPDELSRSTNGMTMDEYKMFSDIRVLTASVCRSELGENLIALYRRELNRFMDEFRPETIDKQSWPRVLDMVSNSDDWFSLVVNSDREKEYIPRLAARSAAKGWTAMGRQQEGERVLAMNPEIIILRGESVERFHHDPRWRGLDAVRNRHVYNTNPLFNGYYSDLDHIPFSARWASEIFHPERLAPQVRQGIREHYLESYGYAITEDQIDELLRVPENSASDGYGRFTRESER
jgi:hypothetical protein